LRAIVLRMLASRAELTSAGPALGLLAGRASDPAGVGVDAGETTGAGVEAGEITGVGAQPR